MAGCNITDSQQYGSQGTGTFFMRVEATTAAPQAELQAALEPVAQAFGMQWSLNPAGRKVRTLLMASTSAHCLNDLLFLQRSGTLPIEIPAIVSNHRDLAGPGRVLRHPVPPHPGHPGHQGPGRGRSSAP